MKTGYWPATSTTSNTTHINFIEDLTEQEKTDVNNIVGDGSTACDPVAFVSLGNRIIVKDIWNWRSQLESDAGFNIAITYRSSGTYGSNVNDEIVLQATDPTYQGEKLLTGNEPKNFMDAVIGLIREE